MLKAVTVAAIALALASTGASAMDWGNFYGKVYGGVTLPNIISYAGDDYQLDQG